MTDQLFVLQVRAQIPEATFRREFDALVQDQFSRSWEEYLEEQGNTFLDYASGWWTEGSIEWSVETTLLTGETEWREDGETWESYARRLEAIIVNQRENLRGMQKLQNQGNKGSRKRVAMLERALGKSELAAFRRREQRQHMHAQLLEAHAETERVRAELADATVQLVDERARVERLRRVLTPDLETP